MEKLKMSEGLKADIVTAYMMINGNKEELFYAKKLNAIVQKIRSKKHGKEEVDWVGKGTMCMYAITPLFRDLICKEIETGEAIDFDIEVIIQRSTEPTTEQKITLKKCQLESLHTTVFDVNIEELDLLEETVSFTYKDFLIE